MRGLSDIEVAGLVDLIVRPDYTADDNDPIIEAWGACVERGLASCVRGDEFTEWDANDLGRLALRVHEAVQQR